MAPRRTRLAVLLLLPAALALPVSASKGGGSGGDLGGGRPAPAVASDLVHDVIAGMNPHPVVSCVAGEDAAQAIASYGCFCGLHETAASDRPVDAVDECCAAHKRCWEKAGHRQKGGGAKHQKLVCATRTFRTACEEGEATCPACTHGDESEATGKPGGCLAAKCCDCDRELGACLLATAGSRSPEFVDYRLPGQLACVPPPNTIEKLAALADLSEQMTALAGRMHLGQGAGSGAEEIEMSLSDDPALKKLAKEVRDDVERGARQGAGEARGRIARIFAQVISEELRDAIRDEVSRGTPAHDIEQALALAESLPIPGGPKEVRVAALEAIQLEILGMLSLARRVRESMAEHIGEVDGLESPLRHLVEDAAALGASLSPEDLSNLLNFQVPTIPEGLLNPARGGGGGGGEMSKMFQMPKLQDLFGSIAGAAGDDKAGKEEGTGGGSLLGRLMGAGPRPFGP